MVNWPINLHDLDSDPKVHQSRMGFNENQVALLVVPMALWALATVAIVLRLVARRVRSTAFDLSDLLIIFSWILLLALAVILVAFVTVGGGGQHVDALSPQQLQMFSVVCLQPRTFLIGHARG